MFDIKTMNSISLAGIEELEKRGCKVGKDVEKPHGMLIRSADLHEYKFNDELLGIARAGAGYNNIPVEDCAERGIVVFNSPGANAQAVMEQEICSLVMSSRDVLGAIDWVRSIADQGENIPTLVEKGKSSFAGPEIMGKTLGVIGLGAVGALVANAALEMGMTVYGYDPFMSVDAAWQLSRSVIHCDNLDEIYRNSDYISLNVPYTESTHHMINAQSLRMMKDGVRIINESRAEVVNDEAMTIALDRGKVAKYVTDFPTAKLIGQRNVICLPHIGACTPESEDKCAVAAARELYDYIVNGNIRNSVNLPDAVLDERQGVCRLCIIHMNVPRMLTRFLEIIGGMNINVEHMINKSRGEYAYTMIDLGDPITLEQIKSIVDMEEVLRVRIL